VPKKLSHNTGDDMKARPEPESTTLTNTAGGDYYALLFAHDVTAGGYMQCGSYVGNGSSTGPVVGLGWKPQFVIVMPIVSNAGANKPATVDDVIGEEIGVLFGGQTSTVGGAVFNNDGFRIATTSGWLNASGTTYCYLAVRKSVA